MNNKAWDLQPILACNGVLLKVGEKIDGKWVLREATEAEQDEYNKESEYNI